MGVKLPSPDEAMGWGYGIARQALGAVGSFVKDKIGGVLELGVNLLGLADSNAPDRLTRMVRAMNAIDAKHYDYVYGGGHGSFAGPYDCSGLVSAILHAGGFIGSPMTTDGLKVWGESGDGKAITVGVRGSSGQNAHTMMKLGNRYLESGGSNGGAKWVSGWDGAFPIHRHPAGYAAGGVRGAEQLSARIAEQLSGILGFGLREGGIVSAPFVGSFGTGGVVPRDGFGYLHGGELVSRGIPEVHVYIGDRELTELVDVRVEERDRAGNDALRAGAIR